MPTFKDDPIFGNEFSCQLVNSSRQLLLFKKVLLVLVSEGLVLLLHQSQLVLEFCRELLVALLLELVGLL